MDATSFLSEKLGFNLGGIFDMMEVVEQEIVTAQKLYPQRKEIIWRAFGMFGREADTFSKYDLRLWRSHVRELLGRVGNPPKTKEEREYGTIAEAIIAFSESSLIHPLDSDATKAYAMLFEQVYGKEKTQSLVNQSGADFYESYRGSAEELTRWIRRKVSKPRDYPEAIDAKYEQAALELA